MPENFSMEIDGEKLLTLILQTKRIKKSSAIRSLGVDEKTLDDWVASLAKGEWIKPVERETEDPFLEVSETAFKRIEEIGKDFIGEEPVKKKEKVEKREKERVIIRIARRIAKINRIALLDALIIGSTFLSFYLVYTFLRNPDRESLSFLFAMILFSTVVLTYKEYERIYKTRELSGSARIIAGTLIEILARRKKHIFATLVILAMLYFVGLSLATRKSPYILLSVVSLTTYILIYQPKQNNVANLRFYMGMLLITYGLLLLGGFSELAVSLPINVALGITILVLVKIKEDYFGVGIKSFREMLDRI